MSKGPLEGFFVSSVEFCKHVKFDKDDRDNRTGTQGPAGPVNNNSTLVNTFNCINPNVININTDTNQSSSLSSSGLQQLIQDGVAQGSNGTLDGLSLNKTIINLCVINDNDSIVIEDAGNVTDGNGNETVTCEDCFSALSTLEKVLFIGEFNTLIAPQAFASVLNLCIDLPGFPDELKDESYTLIQTALTNTPGVDVDERNDILRCLQQLGLIIPPA